MHAVQPGRRSAIVVTAVLVVMAGWPGSQPRAQGGNRVDIVSVAGCLKEQPAGTWMLVNATDPVKSSANAPEKKELPTAPVAGTNQFQLIGVGEYNLPSFKEQLVVVKGLHIVSAPTSRLNITSVTPVFPTCATGAGK